VIGKNVILIDPAEETVQGAKRYYMKKIYYMMVRRNQFINFLPQGIPQSLRLLLNN